MDKEFITSSRRKIIVTFLENGMNSQNLGYLLKEMRGEILKYLDDLVPNTAVTYRTFNNKNDIECPIEVLIESLSNLLIDEDIQEKIHRRRMGLFIKDNRFNVLLDYDNRIKIHVGSCHLCPESRVSS